MPDWKNQIFFNKEVIHSIDKQIDLNSKDLDELTFFATKKRHSYSYKHPFLRYNQNKVHH